MRYAARVDANLSDIVDAFRALLGKDSVHVTNRDWDVTIQYAGMTMLIEVKDGDKKPSARRLTQAQKKLHCKLMIRIVKNVDEAQQAVKTLRTWANFVNAGFRSDINANA